jgi:hypothetical protein
VGALPSAPVETSAVVTSSVTDKIKYVFDGLVGGGNLPDPQQIALIMKGLRDGDLHLRHGETFLFWLQNLLASRVGSDAADPSSVGYLVKDAYFPDIVGAPVPGIIGEALINFGYFAPIFILALCASAVLIYKAAARSGQAIVVLCYSLFLIGVWALLCKVDSSALLGLVRMIAPFGAAWVGVLLFDQVWKWLWYRKSASEPLVLDIENQHHDN